LILIGFFSSADQLSSDVNHPFPVEDKVKDGSDGHHNAAPDVQHVPGKSAKNNRFRGPSALWINQEDKAGERTNYEAACNYSI
jgi:hypothetical protein